MSTRVVVPQRLRASETLQQGVGGENHVLNLLDTAVLTSRDSSDVLHDTLRGLRLSRSGFARDDNALVLVVGIHVVIGRLSDTEHVWGNFQPVLPFVSL